LFSNNKSIEKKKTEKMSSFENNTPILVSENETHRIYNIKGCIFRVPTFLVLEKALGVGAYGLVW
jgi:hypothetical protein